MNMTMTTAQQQKFISDLFADGSMADLELAAFIQTKDQTDEELRTTIQQLSGDDGLEQRIDMV